MRFQLNTIQMLMGIAILTAILVGVKFSFDLAILQTQEKQAEDIEKLASVGVKQNANIERLLTVQANESKTRSTLASEERQRQLNTTEDVKAILQAQGNLTAEQREKLTKALEQNIEAIPELFNLIKNEMEPIVNNSNALLKGRTALIQEIQNNTDLILNTLEARQHEHENQTELLIQGLKETGNATAQADAIEVIKNISESMDQVKEALNITR